MSRPGGRRTNGLQSSDWGALVDLDPRLADSLLDRLASAGVPAFVEPAGSPDSLSRAVHLPHRPLDRLWVDPGRADEARSVVSAEVADLGALLAEQEPGASAHGLVLPVPATAARRVLAPPDLPGAPRRSTAEDDDEAFARIVAGLQQDDDRPVKPWPVVEDVTPDGERPSGDGPSADRPAETPADPHDPQRGDLPGWLEPEALRDEGHYVPPPPPPVGRVSPRTIGAGAVVLLGLLLLFAPGLMGFSSGAQTGMVGVLLLVTGAGLLVWWMRDAPPTDSGPDDGAVV